MGKSVVLCVVAFGLALGMSVSSSMYVKSTCRDVLDVLTAEAPTASKFDEAHDIWDKAKDKLMLITNHQDIEEVAVCLIRGRENARMGEHSMAQAELETAIFLLREFAERERLIAGNVV